MRPGCDIALGLSTGAVGPEQISGVSGDTNFFGLRSDCYFGSGQAYRGNISATWLQLPCQPWNLQTPHAHAETPLSHPDSGLDGNYCRNPRGARERPWCYTNNTDTEWDYCNLPACAASSYYGGSQPYITVDFKHPVQISRMAMARTAQSSPSAMEVAYSMDNITWESYLNQTSDDYTLQANGVADSISYVVFLPKITGRYLSVMPRNTRSNTLEMRLELYGCLSDQKAWSTYTNITENILTNTVWSLANHPFFIQGDIKLSR
ncbi:uncharacterized protein LOC144736556 [Lampetra planeri]